MSSTLFKRATFVATGITALGTSGLLFRDLADLSQWVVKTRRENVFTTFQQRHKLFGISMAAIVANTVISFRRPRPFHGATLPIWALINCSSFGFIFSGYINPELMMRPRNTNAVYVSCNDILNLLKPNESVIVTSINNNVSSIETKAFPDSQVLRPHVVRVGTNSDNIPITMTYCGLTNLGIVYETPNYPDGRPMELVPLSQLENNLVLLDKTTGHIGQQINGMDEHTILEKMNEKCDDQDVSLSFEDTKRRPSQLELQSMNLNPSELGKEVASWRMSLGDYVRTYPNGQVFINDYSMYKSISAPVKSIYDSIMDGIFNAAVLKQAVDPKPVFPTLQVNDKRLPPKELVWAFNVEDDYVAVTESFVRDVPDGICVRNMTVGDKPIVAAWDKDVRSLGIWYRPSNEMIDQPINVHGQIYGKEGTEPLQRLDTVKNGAFWCVWVNFFPQTRINPNQ